MTPECEFLNMSNAHIIIGRSYQFKEHIDDYRPDCTWHPTGDGRPQVHEQNWKGALTLPARHRYQPTGRSA